ncbi:unnamed protein product [Adineta ricciae]|uniref:Uncharacterized protein n=2 Tax=Adineta ricciae TaxID=249248 RepID=A0A815Q9R1_ADIRI|nr:unnamed protein product [Adineta ricciae]
MILNFFSSNWVPHGPSKMLNGWAMHHTPRNYNGCSCALSSKCVSPSRGMLAGCYPLESILQSTMACFYNKTCISQLSYVGRLNVSTLVSSHFPLNTTVESIINELMIEELISNISYDSYFNGCAPLSCTYTYVDDNHVVEAITRLIGLYGGLIIICRLFAVVIVKHILFVTQRIIPTTD